QMINEKIKDKIDVKITNPTGNTLKVKVLDTNMGCHANSFVIGSSYKLLCNKTKDVSTYYIQLQDGNNKIYYGEYTEPPERKKKSNVNYTIVMIIVAGVVVLIAYNNYTNKSRGKDRTAIEQLEDNDNDN
ncbi:MAG: hypothetical protein PF569_10265, partial [Candidatus Woesearchaeota archaeon]|nr:hypothetical protein [Candidatus Woesearchaeota archaeon]